MKKLLAIVIVSLVSSIGLADCRDAYKDALKVANGRVANSMGGAIGGAGSAGLAVLGLAVTASLAATPVVLVSSGAAMNSIQYFVAKRSASHLREILYLIHESYTEPGTQTQALTHKLSRGGFVASQVQVDAWIKYANERNILCPMNDITGEQVVLTHKQILRVMKNEALNFDNRELD